MKNGYIPEFEYLNYPFYQKLREPPQWPVIIAETDKRMAEQREIYLKLVAKEVEIGH